LDPKRELLRHTLAALAYRATRALEDSTENFAVFVGSGKTPGEILAHMGDLFDWALSMAAGKPAWRNSVPLSWAEEQRRFFAALTAFDHFLASEAVLQAPIERLMQGPVADALTHVGQLAMLRRLAGEKVRGENFYVAEMAIGRTGPEQAAPVKAF